MSHYWVERSHTLGWGANEAVARLEAVGTTVHPAGAPGSLEGIRPLATDEVGLRVAVVGLGYVGLPTALALLDGGASVLGIDASLERLDAIRDGRVDLQPTDLIRLERSLALPHFQVSAETIGLRDADVVIICVPTPVDDHLVPDLSALRRACATVVAEAVPGQTFILTSTTYVGTTRDLLAAPLTASGFQVGTDVFVCFSPERIDPGSVGHTSADVPRVIGGITPLCAERAGRILRLTTRLLYVVSSPEAAELTKLHENTFRAVNLALVNELADLASTLKLDVMEVIDAASTKPYGFMRFTPGPGVGGHCIPCDPHYLLWQMRSLRKEAPLIERAMQSIALRPSRVVDRVRQVLSDNGCPMNRARIHIVGVAYKPGVQDVRESPAIDILAQLRELGAAVSFTDPLVPEIILRDGGMLKSVDPDPGKYDLVLVHTLHPGVDRDWLLEATVLLDASYTLSEIAHAVAV